MVRGEQKTIVPMSRSLLPLPLKQHAVLLAMSILPPLLASRLDDFADLNNVMLVVIATLYLALRIHLSKRRYPKAPTIEVSAHEIVLPYFQHGSRVERVFPTQNIQSIEFIKGTGSLNKIDTSVVFTDDQWRQCRLSGFNVNLLLLREALEKYEVSYTRRRNPKQIAHLVLLAVAGAGAVYLYMQMI